ncbi:hypothetical protein F511_30764 [Dorcoceras hygrometricum]|uniref:Uncharacterized protein n=1 Tax=Dorcoceras hygrometricum TaxID=472368 RepID=A0A2Z7AZI9_9LAMI|nr:hypothetical protein F511_30764 [Dorcoceras hygrometricum]
MNGVAAVVDEAAAASQAGGRRGGWITFPFMIATMIGLMLAAGGWLSNLIVYLIQEFNFKSISAAQVYNYVNGSITMFPIIGAIIADSYVGGFSVIWFSSIISLLGILLLLLTAAFNQLRPPACEDGSNVCEHSSQLQLAVLYLGLALSSLGNAGTRFTIAPMGADQFDSPENQSVFFNWYIITMYTATVVSSTAIVFVEDNVSWTLGFGLCVGANVIGLAVFLSGRRFYRLVKPKGSPFKSLACVIVAAFGKRKMLLSEKSEDYFHGLDKDATETKNPSKFSRFLNKAALITEDNSITNPWKQTTVQQVEDLKTLIKLFPLWSTGLFLCTPLAIQLSLAIIQALTMDRQLGSGLKIPAGTMPIFILIATSLTILLLDRLIFPLWKKITQKPLTLLQRVGIGHALTVISMAVSAVVESRRLKVVRSNNLQSQVNAIAPMSVFWLVPPLALAGIGEAFHFPGNVALYYQEFPESLKSTSTAAIAMFIGIAFYLSNAIIDLFQRTTGWLPDDINHGRLDNVYWFCCIMGAMNFAYYLVCTSFTNESEKDKGQLKLPPFCVESSRPSLAWDAAFFNSSGFLDQHELSIINQGFRSQEPTSHPLKKVHCCSGSNKKCSRKESSVCSPNPAKALCRFRSSLMKPSKMDLVRKHDATRQKTHTTPSSARFSYASPRSCPSHLKRMAPARKSEMSKIGRCSERTKIVANASPLPTGIHSKTRFIKEPIVMEYNEAKQAAPNSLQETGEGFLSAAEFRPSGIRPPSPKIGFFDEKTPLFSRGEPKTRRNTSQIVESQRTPSDASVILADSAGEKLKRDIKRFKCSHMNPPNAANIKGTSSIKKKVEDFTRKFSKYDPFLYQENGKKKVCSDSGDQHGKLCRYFEAIDLKEDYQQPFSHSSNKTRTPLAERTPSICGYSNTSSIWFGKKMK